VAQHLTESVFPFGDESVGKLRYLIRRRGVPTPHSRLRSLVLSVIGNELTAYDEKVFTPSAT
jgi:hypothetical protein